MRTFNRITMVNKIVIYFIMAIVSVLLMFCCSVGFIEALKSLLCLITKLLKCCWTSRFVVLLMNIGILAHLTKWDFLYQYDNKREQDDLYSGLLKKSESRFSHCTHLMMGSEGKTSSLEEAKLICRPIHKNGCFEKASKPEPSESVEESTNTVVMEDTSEESVIDEEFNRKVEAFILKFNHQMRLQRLESLKRHGQIMVE